MSTWRGRRSSVPLSRKTQRLLYVIARRHNLSINDVIDCVARDVRDRKAAEGGSASTRAHTSASG